MGDFIKKVQQFFGKDEDAGSGSGETSPPENPQTGYKVEHIQQTPNPEAVQFIMNQPVIISGTRSLVSAEQAHGDDLGEALFGIFGVENVYFKENFVTINKSPVRGWNHLVEEITHVLETRLTLYDSTEAPSPAAELELSPELKEFTPDTFIQLSDEEKKQIIDVLFEHSIRPALAYDGGGLTLQGVKGNVVQIEYQGSCGSCPSSRSGTLLHIENILKENLHPDLEVQAV